MTIGIDNKNSVRQISNGNMNRRGKIIRGEGQYLLNVTRQLWIHRNTRYYMTSMVDSTMEKVNLKKENI